jgi:hypothetical protein
VGREDFTWIGLALALLIGGLLLGQRFLDPQSHDAGLSDSMAFRQWLWESRSLDLAVQAGLILTGALAIAALLPRPGETDGGAQDSRPASDPAMPGQGPPAPTDEAR